MDVDLEPELIRELNDKQTPTKSIERLIQECVSKGLMATAITLSRALPRPLTTEPYRANPQISLECTEDLAIAHHTLKQNKVAYNLICSVLASPKLEMSQRPRLQRNRHRLLTEEGNKCHRGGKDVDDVIKDIRCKKNPNDPRKPHVTFSITSCKRLDLFERTMNSFLECCTDINLIDRWVCVDDNSTEEDREKMKTKYPFFEFVWKTKDNKGHAKSMNIIRDMVAVDTDTLFLFHSEDDFEYVEVCPYISQLLEILEQNSRYGQALVNREYAEVSGDVIKIVGGIRRRTSTASELVYVEHEYFPSSSGEYRNHLSALKPGQATNAYWPHFSFRPSLIRVDAWRELGPFNETAKHFELEYAERYTAAGYISASLDGVYCIHTGRLTTERGGSGEANSGLNAYDLNGEQQFGVPFTAAEAVGGKETEVVGPGKEIEHGPAATKTKVCLSGFFCDSERLCTLWEKMTKGNRMWNDLHIVSLSEMNDEEEPDYYVVNTCPYPGERINPSKTLLFPMEPNMTPDRWGRYANPDKHAFLHVHDRSIYPQIGEWHLSSSWTWLMTHNFDGEKHRILSAVVSPKYTDPGHRRRIDFLKYLDSKISIDIYGSENTHGYRGYKGPLPPYRKDDGLLPYRYTFNAENHALQNYFTEKLVDAILAECLCFYWGCPNVGNYIDPRAFIQLDITDHEQALETIRKSIENDEYSTRLPAIREARKRILTEHQLFPTVERLINEHKQTGAINHPGAYYVDGWSLRDELQFLRSSMGFSQVIECGTGNGTMTELFAGIFDKVYSVELLTPLHTKAINGPLANVSNIVFLQGNAKATMRQKLFGKLDGKPAVVHIDSERLSHDPFLEEVHCVLENLPGSVFVVHRATDDVFQGYERLDFPPSGETRENRPIFVYFPTDGIGMTLRFAGLKNSYVINLDRRPDRLEAFAKRYASKSLALDVQRFSAVDGHKLESSEELERVFQGNDFGWRSSFIGTALSHIQLWKLIGASDPDEKERHVPGNLSSLIMEDDVEFDDHFNVRLHRALQWLANKEWDILYCGHHLRSVWQSQGKHRTAHTVYHTAGRETALPLKLYRVDDAQTQQTVLEESIGGLYCYVITKRGALRLSRYVEENGVQNGIDYYITANLLNANLCAYYLEPHIAFSEVVSTRDGADSDIQYDFRTLGNRVSDIGTMNK